MDRKFLNSVIKNIDILNLKYKKDIIDFEYYKKHISKLYKNIRNIEIEGKKISKYAAEYGLFDKDGNIKILYFPKFIDRFKENYSEEIRKLSIL